MAEIYIPYSLVTPAGTINFNPEDNSDALYLSDVAGLDGGVARSTVVDLPQRDGSYLYDTLLGAATPTLTGEIRMPTSGLLSVRQTLMDDLRAACDSIRTADGTLTWSPTGAADSRQLTVRTLETVEIGNPGGILKTFQIQFAAANPFAVSSTQQSGVVSGALPVVGGALTFPFKFPFTFGDAARAVKTLAVGGDLPAYPIITIHGPLDGPTITNVNTGELLSFSGLTLGATDSLVIDCWNETVLLNGSDALQYLDFAVSDFFTLSPGVTNTIHHTGANSSGTTSITVAWNDTWTA